jgi:hypothetical protein
MLTTYKSHKPRKKIQLSTSGSSRIWPLEGPGIPLSGLMGPGLPAPFLPSIHAQKTYTSLSVGLWLQPRPVVWREVTVNTLTSVQIVLYDQLIDQCRTAQNFPALPAFVPGKEGWTKQKFTKNNRGKNLPTHNYFGPKNGLQLQGGGVSWSNVNDSSIWSE